MERQEFLERIQQISKNFIMEIEMLEAKAGESTGIIEILKAGIQEQITTILGPGVRVMLEKIDEEEEK